MKKGVKSENCRDECQCSLEVVLQGHNGGNAGGCRLQNSLHVKLVQLRQLAHSKHADPHVIAGVSKCEGVGGCLEQALDVRAGNVEGGE